MLVTSKLNIEATIVVHGLLSNLSSYIQLFAYHLVIMASALSLESVRALLGTEELGAGKVKG